MINIESRVRERSGFLVLRNIFLLMNVARAPVENIRTKRGICFVPGCGSACCYYNCACDMFVTFWSTFFLTKV